MDWRDRTIAIVLGVVLGVGVVVAFVFLFSERTVDAPSLSTVQASAGGHDGRNGRHPRHSRGGQDRHPKRRPARPPPVATVRIVGGAPPRGGPAELRYDQGDAIRLSVRSDETLAVELTGYDVTRTIPAGQPTEIDVQASQPGSFALIAADSHIDVARLSVAEASP